MSTINCYLLDDENLANDRLFRLLKPYTDINIIGKESCPSKAIDDIIRLNPDIIFMDVEMPVLSGFEAVKLLKEKGVRSTFIFITGYDQYAIKAIRNEAFDYLVKPIDIDDLNNALDRYRNKNNTIHIPEGWELSHREKEILSLIVKGKTSKQIAEDLFLSKHTIDTHRKHILEKSGFENTSQVIGFMSSNGI